MTPTEQALRDALKMCLAALQSQWSPYLRAGDKEAAAMKAASAALSLPAAEPMTEEMSPPEGKRWFYCDTGVKECNGYQTWRVAASSLDEAKQLFEDGDGEIESEEIEVTDIGAPKWHAETHHGIGKGE